MRFVLHNGYDLTPEKRFELGLDRLDPAGSVLVDTFTGESWTDQGEPEDAMFCRDWSWVPAKLNELADEIEYLKKCVKRGGLSIAPHRFEDAWDSFEGGDPGSCAFPFCGRLGPDPIHTPPEEHAFEPHPKLPLFCRYCGYTSNSEHGYR